MVIQQPPDPFMTCFVCRRVIGEREEFIATTDEFGIWRVLHRPDCPMVR